MWIIVRFILRNIREKKLRTFLILFSIAISTALLFASKASSDNLVKLTLERMGQSFGSADIVVLEGEKSPSPFFHTNFAEKLDEQLEYVIGAIQGAGFNKYPDKRVDRINLYAFKLEELQKMNPVRLEQESNLYPFTGKKAVISKKTAERYGLKAGQSIDLEINKVKQRFVVSGISYPTGLFLEGGGIYNAVIPKETLAMLYNADGKVNAIYIKLKKPEDKQRIIKQLSDAYKRYVVKEPFTMDEVRQETSGMSTAFMIMTVLVFCMSAFIIFSSFRVIIAERLPVIGTFRSIGASRKLTELILLSESFLYGIIGGISGCLIGIGLLYLISAVTAPPWAKNIQTGPGPQYVLLIISFLAAVLLSVISSIIPVIKASRIPLKDIVSDKIESNAKRSKLRLVHGLSFLVTSLVLPPLTPKKWGLYADSLCVVLAVASIIMLTPYLIGLFVQIIEKIYAVPFGNIGSLAAKNLRNNKGILNNITLLSIGISSLLMINTVSFSVLTGITDSFSTRLFDVMVAYAKADKAFERSIRSVEGVEGAYSIYEEHNLEVVGKGFRISGVQGIDKDKHFMYWKTDIEGNAEDLAEELDKGRNIVITNSLRESLGVKLGDNITLKMKQGNRTYRIIGFFNSMLFYGNHALVSGKYLKMDMGTQYYYRVFIKTSIDPVALTRSLKEKFSRMQPEIWVVKQLQKENIDSNGQLFKVLRGFSGMMLVIGVFGVFNNFVISFIERKRFLAVYRSIGMSRSQIIRMIFVEALTGGVMGGFTGVCSGILLTFISEYVLKAINQPVEIHFSSGILLFSFFAGVVITLVASVSPAKKTSRLNIMESLKYE